MKKYLFDNLSGRGVIEQDGIAYGYNDNNIISNHDTHTHDYYEITYMCDGEAVQIINNRSYYVTKGSLIVLSPSDYHSHHSLTKINPLSCCFKDTNMLSFFPDSSVFPLVINLDFYFQQQIEHLFYLLMEEIKQDKPQHARAEWNFLDSIFLLITRNLDNTSQKTTSSMERVLTYTVEHLKDVQFSDVVQIYGTSEGNFCRMFKKTFGTTFTEFVVNLRIQQAKKLLLNTHHTVETIYRQCGYNNSRPFYLDFKRKCGMTPHQYRKKGNFLPIDGVG